MNCITSLTIFVFCCFLVVKFVLCPMLAPLDKISNEDFKEVFGYDKDFHILEITNAFFSLFCGAVFLCKM